jgi:hypothetical protein
MNDQLTQAAESTMRGGADVTLDLFYKFEGEDPGRGHLAGTVDFDAGRCELSGDGERFVLDGGDEYRTQAGSWLVSRGKPGTQSMMHPAWLLARLTDAVTNHARIGDEIVGTLDRDRASATSIGIADEWTPSYRVTIDDGRIATMAFELVGADGEVGMSESFTLTPAPIAPIALPEDATPSDEALSL